MIPDPPPADVLAPRLAHNLWGMRGVRTYARVTAEHREGREVYRGTAGHTVTTGTGGLDVVVTEEYASSEDAWTALAGELKARGGRS